MTAKEYKAMVLKALVGGTGFSTAKTLADCEAEAIACGKYDVYAAGSFLPLRISDNLHDVNDLMLFMAESGYRGLKDTSTSTSTQVTSETGLTVCVNGYVCLTRKSIFTADTL